MSLYKDLEIILKVIWKVLIDKFRKGTNNISTKVKLFRVRASKGEVVLFWVFWLHNPKQLGDEMQKPKWHEDLTCKEDSAKWYM